MRMEEPRRPPIGWGPRLLFAVHVFMLLTGAARAGGASTIREVSQPHHLPVLGMMSVPADACSLVAASGFSVVHNYGFETGDFPSTAAYITRALIYLDAADCHGLRVLLGVPRLWLEQRREAMVVDCVRGLRQHPALFAWYEDEVAQRGDRGAVELLDSVVRREDPAHGLVIEEAKRDDSLLEVGRARMFTYYAVTTEARQRGRLPTIEDRFPVHQLRRPFWPVLQAYGHEHIAGLEAVKFLVPERRELQYTLYSSLIAGAHGIFFYPYLHPTTFDKVKQKQSAWPYGRYLPLPIVDPTLWATVQITTAEAQRLLERIVTAVPCTPNAYRVRPGGKVEDACWQVADGTLVLFANSSSQPVSLDVILPGDVPATRLLHEGLPSAARQVKKRTVRVELPGPGGVALLLEKARQ